MQRYRLRLGDGTILAVDRAGLATWVADDGAMVQAVGSQRWQPLKQFLAHQRVIARQASQQDASAGDALSPPPLKPREEEPAPILPPPAPAQKSTLPGPSDPAEPGSIGEPLGVQVLADEPGAATPASGPHPPAAGEEASVIPLKPLEDEAPRLPTSRSWSDPLEPVPGGVRADPRAVPAFAEPRIDDEGEGRGRRPRYRLVETLLRPVSSLGTFLGRCLDLAQESFVEDGWSHVAAKLRPIGSGASAWIEGFTGRVGRLARPDRPSPSVPASPPAASGPFLVSSEPTVSGPPAVPRPPGLEPTERLEPPPSLGALPVIRLAPSHEPKHREDLDEGADFDEGEDTYGGVGLVHAAWPRARRFLVVTAVLAGGVWAALARDAWMPTVTRLGRVVFTEVDGRVRARHEAGRQEQALREASEQMPYLAPETLDLVLSNSPSGMLGPPEVFRLACDAVDRGSSALTAGDRRQLERLRRDLRETLSPVERDELRDYDRARAQRATFAFEDQEALRLFARGARALPSRSRERLRALFGQAIAAAFATEDAPSP